MSERLTVFDIEVLNAEPSSICAIGVVVLEDLKVVDEYYSLIRPRDMRHDPFRYKIHHILPQDLFKQPTFKQVWQEIAPYFESQIVIAHDIQADMSCLRAALKRHHIEYPSLRMSCTNVLAHMFLPESSKYSLTDLCAYYHIPLEHAHHALADAQACAALLVHMMKVHGYTSLVELHADRFLAFGEMKSNYYRNIISPDLVTGGTPKKLRQLEKSVAFTGKMALSKDDLLQMAHQAHFHVSHDVNTHTSCLVIGNINYSYIRYSGKNRKVVKALKLIEEGQDLKIMSEKDFLDEIKGRRI